MSQRVDLKWPVELVEAIDAARGDVPRSAWMKRACQDRLARDGVPGPRVSVTRGEPAVSRADAFRGARG